MLMWGVASGLSAVIVRVRSPRNPGYESWSKKTRVPWLPDGEMRVILRSLVLSQYQRVTDGRTDTPPMSMSRSGIAECDNITVYVISI